VANISALSLRTRRSSVALPHGRRRTNDTRNQGFRAKHSVSADWPHFYTDSACEKHLSLSRKTCPCVASVAGRFITQRFVGPEPIRSRLRLSLCRDREYLQAWVFRRAGFHFHVAETAHAIRPSARTLEVDPLWRETTWPTTRKAPAEQSRTMFRDSDCSPSRC